MHIDGFSHTGDTYLSREEWEISLNLHMWEFHSSHDEEISRVNKWNFVRDFDIFKQDLEIFVQESMIAELKFSFLCVKFAFLSALFCHFDLVLIICFSLFIVCVGGLWWCVIHIILPTLWTSKMGDQSNEPDMQASPLHLLSLGDSPIVSQPSCMHLSWIYLDLVMVAILSLCPSPI